MKTEVIIPYRAYRINGLIVMARSRGQAALFYWQCMGRGTDEQKELSREDRAQTY